MQNNSGHAEAVEIQVHRPDGGERLVGSSYRSEISLTSDEQGRVAEETIPAVDASGHWPGKVVTEISDAPSFPRRRDEGGDPDVP